NSLTYSILIILLKCPSFCGLSQEAAKLESASELPCPVANSRLTSSLLKIAGLLEEGGVCGIPTDTVYALAASCKNPQAIEKIYNIKDRPAEKPICICISNVEQLVTAKPPFTPLLWEFMRNVYPGGISCIVSKGDWLFRLVINIQLTFQFILISFSCVGDSIMIRVPDHTVTGHLCNITGPLAITSANPSGEPDTCRTLFTGTITIVREGCVPAVKVQQIFDRVKSTMV
uniref:Threonylcarbamoyl-AMP synthase n=1 Tax=Dicentrarchus labrax TaxID=13489 RepID=A0A8C4ENT9_DICLA